MAENYFNFNLDLELLERLQRVGEYYSEFAKEWSDRITGTEINCTYARLEDSCKKLAKLGWTIPSDATPREIIHLGEECTDNQINRWITKHFEKDQNKELNQLFKRLNKNDNLKPWLKLIRECTRCYGLKMHYIVVPAMLTILEGYLALLCDDTKDIRMIAPIKSMIKNTGPDTFKSLFFNSILFFIEELYRKSEFSETRPKTLNRHRVLHGRDATNWNKTDCIRLFHAIDTLGIMGRTSC